MVAGWILFIDDGGVMNDNPVRERQWRQLLGEFFPPLLGGTPAAWAEANRVVMAQLMEDYARRMYGQADPDYSATASTGPTW
jgi:hypothetical protein